MPADTLTIVTARNEAERIGATLAALARSLPGVPVMLADDGSSDATAEIASEAGARVLRGGSAIGKGGVATLAARAALQELGPGSGEEAVVLFCDGDLGDSAARLAALVHAVRAGYSYVEVPLTHRDRSHGRSKAVSARNILKALQAISRLWWAVHVQKVSIDREA